ncbi:MAG: C69 family dipeptidase, partial [Mesotoga sp.]|nr:C69 family dipeptidase [Mesotoga sp.]
MRRLLIAILFVLFIFHASLFACTDIMVGKLATTDGSVISSQTVNGTYDSRIIIVPAADHEPGEMAP